MRVKRSVVTLVMPCKEPEVSISPKGPGEGRRRAGTTKSDAGRLPRRPPRGAHLEVHIFRTRP